ncbi:MAG TPA: alpha-amylase family protein [Edaphobacter sp.]|nr:alpha-amylase family protein [Edaphobacter sp.]
MKTTRRKFALLGGAAITAASLPLNILAQTSSPARQAKKFPADAWHQRLKRIMQVNFNEHDPENFDVEAWADYLASCKAQATFLSITNIVAFYPTKLPDYPTSPFLKGRDLFGECAKAAHARGIRIMGRMSPDLAHSVLAEKHPEWFRRNSDGSLMREQGLGGESHDPSMSTQIYAPTCQFTSYYSEYLPAIMNEILSRYEIDGIYANGWPGVNAPKCYCETCRKIGDPNTSAYSAAYLKRAKELWDGYSTLLAAHNPEMIFSGNLGGGFKGGDLDLKELTASAAWFLADNQGRGPLGEPAWDASQQTRIAKAIVGDRPVPNSTGAYTISGAARWRNVTGNASEVRLRLMQTAAAGGVLYYHWLGFQQGFFEDRRWQELGREFLSWQAANDRHFHNLRSITNVALVVAQRSNRLYKAPPGTNGLDSIQGMYSILTEARVPFDVVLSDDLSAQTLQRYSVLILPNMALMSDIQKGQIEAFVAKGGALLATFETGLYDENGGKRSDFALAELFRMHKAGDRQGFGTAASGLKPANPGVNSEQRIERQHPVVASFNDTHLIQGSSWRVPLAPESEPVLTHIAAYPMYPTEAVYSREPHTREAVAIVREHGPSRLVYLAEDVEAGYWRTSAGDLGDLVTNSIRWLVGDSSPIKVDGDGLIEIYGWETEPGYAIHLVNFTNPYFRAGITRRTYAAGEQKVQVVLRDSKPIREAHLLRAGLKLSVAQKGKNVEFTIPRLVDYEMAVLET